MKCKDPNHKRYPCPNRYGHVVHVEQAEGEPPGAGLETAERVLGQDSYCPVCDGCDLCGYVMNPPTFPRPSIVIDAGELSLGRARNLAERMRAGDGIALPASAVYHIGAQADAGGKVRLLVNEQEVGPEEFARALRRVPGIPVIVPEGSGDRVGGGIFTLARRLEESDGFGFSPPGATAARMLKSVLALVVDSCGWSPAALVRDIIRGPEREKNDLGRSDVYARLLIFLLEAARRAGHRTNLVLIEAHRLVDEKEAARQKAAPPVAALDAKHKVVRLPMSGGQETYTCVPCGAGIVRMEGPAAVSDEDWAKTKADYFAEHGEPRI
jgi:hypothetical protein